MLKAIFYARFHPERGPSIIHQYPPKSVIEPNSASEQVLFNYSDISSYIIPPYDVCNQPLAICTGNYRILGYPVSLEDAKYARNRYTFNVCFVLDEDVYTTSWDPVVQKTANFFGAIEEEDGMLQAEEDLSGLKWAGDDGYPTADVGCVYGLLRAIFEQLNAYGEVCAPLNDLHVLNLRLIVPKSCTRNVRAWDVPLLIRALPSPDEWTCDLTLQRIKPHIDGVKHVQRIAEDADVELRLVKKAIEGLMYHERVMLLDIFHFQAIYTPTEHFAAFVKDDKILGECCEYVLTSSDDSFFKSHIVAEPALLTKDTLIQLYRSLNPGTTIHDFCIANEEKLSKIDIRRFITFGEIKGFLRRVHKYPLAIESKATTPQLRHHSSDSVSSKPPKSFEDQNLEIERAWKKAALSSGWPTPPMDVLAEKMEKAAVAGEGGEEEDERLRGFLNGKHCMDEICVAMHLSEKKIAQRLNSGRFGEVVIICK